VNRSLGGFLRAGIGIAISLASLAFVLRGVDLARTAQILGNAAPAWLAVSIALQGVDLSLRTLRWQRLLAPIAGVRFLRVLRYLLVGYLANNVLPARLGEIVRSHYLGDREGISRASALGTIVVERVVDTAVVVAIGALAILVLRVRGVVASAVLVGLAVTALLVVGLAVGIAAHRIPGAGRVMAFLERRPRIAEIGRRLHVGLAVARRPRTLVAAVGLTGLAWGASILSFSAAGQSIGLQLTMGQAALLVSGVALATAIPSGPGYLGTFELAAVKVGEAVGLPNEPAFALAVLVHASILVVTSSGGAIAFLQLGWRRSAGEVGEVARGVLDGDGLIEVALEPEPGAPNQAPGPPAAPVSPAAPGPSRP
jgi:glycosyltransferase 2 family protein